MMDLKFFLLITCWGMCVVNSHKTIPEYLRECYENVTFNGPLLPMNLQILIDIVRKAEKFSETSINMRTMSASLLHRFKFDGIEYYSTMKVKEGILPFSGTGSQRSKHQIIQELIPGNPLAFPSEALTLIERCTLHRAISNTIWEHGNASEDKLCIEGVTEKLSDRSLPIAGKLCPIESGVILTPFGTIAPGAVISAIAASLQPQNVTVKLLLETPNFQPSDRSMWLKMIKKSTTSIDNIWVATVAGDLAEMAVYQGPVEGKRMTLGATGFWNSSMRPNIYYLMGRDGTFDATRAEIIGAVDGLVIAKNLPNWVEKFENLRLSQVFDMYYSNKRSIFDMSVRACDRGKAFWRVSPKSIIEDQTYATSQILAYRNSVAYMEENVLKNMVKHAINAFNSYTTNNLFTELHCQRNDKAHPRVEVIVVFDGAWSQDYTADFLSVMVDDFDVSIFGSKMGIIHATTGEWLLNVTDSPARVHYALANMTNVTWPTKINFEKVLSGASKYFNASWKEKHEAHKIGNLGQVIIFLAPRVRFNTVEQQNILRLIQQVKTKNPDVHFLYYVSEDNASLFSYFLLSEEDHLVQKSSINEMTDVLQTVSRVLRPAACNPSIKEGVRDQIEDYVSPRESVVYRLHPYWRRNTKNVTLTVHNFGYGTIEICTWTQRKNNVRKEGFYCTDLSGHSDTTIIDYATCNEKTICNTTYYEISGISSKKQCAEIDCRTPDYIRYIMRVENLYCSNATNSSSIVLYLLTALTFIIVFHKNY